ncbi:MAG TPA: response regulator [Planctomycetota bacterium]|nr:response regulator [Planctomycetota bacterium]
MLLKKVLIVDDSTTMRKIIARVLRQADISIEHVIEASNGVEGLERLASDPDIQLVLSDVNMPTMDGIAFVRAVRATHAKEALPLIMVTTEGGERMVKAALDSGANGYVTKPFNSDTMRGALEEVLG